MLNVYSETGRLKKVLLHRPGKELAVLNSDNFKEDLFDEIPDPAGAVKEHDVFSAIFKDNGVEVVYLEDMMAEILKDGKVRDSFIRDYLLQAGCRDEMLYQE
ncbi:MAG: arginine deiminase, partial [Erysipelotrichaceae bacterium]|nr:arginine deiminase [Erysipelotrichaceae bacterium]